MGDEEQPGVKIEETRTLSTDEGGAAAETNEDGTPKTDEPEGDDAPEGDEPEDEPGE